MVRGIFQQDGAVAGELELDVAGRAAFNVHRFGPHLERLPTA